MRRLPSGNGGERSGVRISEIVLLKQSLRNLVQRCFRNVSESWLSSHRLILLMSLQSLHNGKIDNQYCNDIGSLTSSYFRVALERLFWEFLLKRFTATNNQRFCIKLWLSVSVKPSSKNNATYIFIPAFNFILKI